MKFLFFILFPFIALAQTRDLITVESLNIPGQSEQSTSLSMGLWPIKLGDVLWLQSASRREIRLDDLDDFPDVHLRLREYSYAPVFVTDLKTGWKMSLGTFLSFRMADEEFLVHTKSTKLIGFLTFSPPGNETNRLKWFWGFFVPDRAFGVPFFAGAGLEYTTAGEKWNFILRFPQISAQYQVHTDWMIGAFLRYQSSSFYINDHKTLKPLGTYVENKSFSAGLMSQYQVSRTISTHLRLGYNIRNQTSILDSSYDQVRALNESPGFFLGISLGWKMP